MLGSSPWGEKKALIRSGQKKIVCDLRKTRTPTMGTGIPRSIQLNYEAYLDRKVNIFY